MRSEFITWQTLPISDPAVRMRLTTGDLIMIHRDDLHLGVVGLCSAQKARSGGWYIEVEHQGKPVRRPLKACTVILIDGQPSIFQFRLTNPKMASKETA